MRDFSGPGSEKRIGKSVGGFWPTAGDSSWVSPPMGGIQSARFVKCGVLLFMERIAQLGLLSPQKRRTYLTVGARRTFNEITIFFMKEKRRISTQRISHLATVGRRPPLPLPKPPPVGVGGGSVGSVTSSPPFRSGQQSLPAAPPQVSSPSAGNLGPQEAPPSKNGTR